MENEQVLWDTRKRYPDGSIDMERGGCMSRGGDSIFYEYHSFDGEENRTYSYYGTFKVEDYKRAIAELEKAHEAEINGSGCRLHMKRLDDRIELTFHTVPTPSAAEHHGASIRGRHTMDTLLLQE